MVDAAAGEGSSKAPAKADQQGQAPQEGDPAGAGEAQNILPVITTVQIQQFIESAIARKLQGKEPAAPAAAATAKAADAEQSGQPSGSGLNKRIPKKNKTGAKGASKRRREEQAPESDSDIYGSDLSDMVEHASPAKKRKQARATQEQDKHYSDTDSDDSSQEWERLDGYRRSARRRKLRLTAAAPARYHKAAVREEQGNMLEPMLCLEDAIAHYKITDMEPDDK